MGSIYDYKPFRIRVGEYNRNVQYYYMKSWGGYYSNAPSDVVSLWEKLGVKQDAGSFCWRVTKPDSNRFLGWYKISFESDCVYFVIEPYTGMANVGWNKTIDFLTDGVNFLEEKMKILRTYGLVK